MIMYFHTWVCARACDVLCVFVRAWVCARACDNVFSYMGFRLPIIFLDFRDEI